MLPGKRYTGPILDRPSPSLLLAFAMDGALDSRVTFTRASSGTRFDYAGVMQTETTDAARFTHDPATYYPSSTSNSISGGRKTFAVSYQYTVGTVVQATYDASNWMRGTVIAASGSSVTIRVEKTAGSGTYAAWNLIQCLGLLIEESRTNLLTYSEEFDNAAWTKTANGTGINASVTPNDAVAPDGTTTADLLVLDRGAGNTLSDSSALLSAAVSFTSGVTYSSAVYFKAATVADIGKEIGFRHAGASAYTVIALTSSWVRYDASELAGITFSGNLEISNRGGVTADNTVSAHIWGAQLEAGSFPTSYIKTTSSTATRAADVPLLTGSNFSSVVDITKGSLVAAYRSPGVGTCPIVSIDDDSTNNQFRVYTSTLDPKFTVVSGGSTVADLDAGAITANSDSRIAAAYAANDYAASSNGGAAVTDASGALPVSPTIMRIGHDKAGNYLNGPLASLAVYPARLSNSYLQYLTS